MANIATITEVRQIGLARESVRGTAETAPTKFLSLTKDSNIDFTTKQLTDPALRGYSAQFASFAGAQEGKGPFKTPARAQNMGEYLHMLFGNPVSTELASFVVVGHTVFTVTLSTNDYIDFIEGAGTAKAAQLTAGTYTVDELCAEVKKQLEAANLTAVTYTVTFSATTKKFTITPSASTINLLWATGTNTAKAADTLLGFSADVVGSAAATSATAVTYVATANDAIPFTEDGGSEVCAFLTPGTYKMEANSGVAGGLCKLIKDQMETINGTSKTYTVTYVAATKKLTLTTNTGVFVLKWTTGVNARIACMGLLGFSADSSSGIAATSDTVTADVPYQHVFTQGQTVQLPSYCAYIDRGAFNSGAKDIKQYTLLSMSKLKVSGKDDAPLDVEASLLAQLEASYSGSWSPSFVDSPALMFSDTVITVGGSVPSVPNISEWSAEFDPGMKAFRPISGQKYPQDFLAAGPFMGSGDYTVFFMDQAERAKFLAVTLSSLRFKAEGTVVGGGTQKYTLDILLPNIEYEGSFAFGDEQGFLAAKAKWKTKGAITSGAFVPQATVTLINAVPSYT